MIRSPPEKMAGKTHVLALPLPFQGHINPMLQFCKRLASRGIMVTLATVFSANISVQNRFESIRIEFIPDTSGIEAATSLADFVNRVTATISDNLPEIVEEKARCGEPVKVIMHDLLLPRALETVYKLGIPVAAFSTQSCAVCAIYNHVRRGTLKIPLEKPNISLPSLPVLESNDLPSFVYDPCAYPDPSGVLLDQITILEKADWIFFNTFDNLEKEVLEWTANQYPIKSIGPAIPSVYLDKRLKDDTDYSLSLFKPTTKSCMEWLDSKEIDSVVYVSFGSLSDIGENQLAEIAWGLMRSDYNFLWVIRASEESKLPSNFQSKARDKGLILNWCPQLEVLSQQAVGCFMTHCGWNSTLEALSLGVPMVTMPVWVDQTTNSKYIVDVWDAGVRVQADENGVLQREEVEMTIKEVMRGEKANKLRKNALRWKELAIKAMSDGGSSDQNIEEFVSSMPSI
nr:UDP-glycosyltransferase 74E2-like [Coffea arabica]